MKELKMTVSEMRLAVLSVGNKTIAHILGENGDGKEVPIGKDDLDYMESYWVDMKEEFEECIKENFYISEESQFLYDNIDIVLDKVKELLNTYDKVLVVE